MHDCITIWQGMRDTQLYSPAQPPLTTGRHRYSISDLISILSSFERGKGDAVHTNTHMQVHPHPHTLASMRTRTYIYTLARTSPSNFLPLLCLLAYFFFPFRHTDTHTCACAHAQAMVIHHIITGFCWGYMLAMNFAYTFACVGCLCEFTTPLLAIRWFMALTHLKSHNLYIVNGLVILVGWWVLRIFIFVGFFGWKIFIFHSTGLLTLRDAPIVLVWAVASVLQVHWCQKLTKGFAKVVHASMQKSA